MRYSNHIRALTRELHSTSARARGSGAHAAAVAKAAGRGCPHAVRARPPALRRTREAGPEPRFQDALTTS